MCVRAYIKALYGQQAVHTTGNCHLSTGSVDKIQSFVNRYGKQAVHMTGY